MSASETLYTANEQWRGLGPTTVKFDGKSFRLKGNPLIDKGELVYKYAGRGSHPSTIFVPYVLVRLKYNVGRDTYDLRVEAYTEEFTLIRAKVYSDVYPDSFPNFGLGEVIK